MLRYSSKSIISSAESNIQHSTEIIQIKIDEYLNELESDIQYLSSSPLLDRYLSSSLKDDKQLLSENYLALIKSKPDYSQVRFIANDEFGNEVVRVDRKKDDCFIVEDKNLQIKGDRPYFKETVNFPNDKVYYSKIDLNKEFGKISIPHTPTLRVAKAIYHNGKVRGVIVINTNLTKLFETLSNTVKDDYSLRILNDHGFYLLHENPDSTFLFETSQSLSPQFTLSKLEKRKGGLFELENDRVMAYGGMKYGESTEELVYFVIADKNKVLNAYKKWRRDSLLIILIIGLLFTLVAFYVLTRQSRTLVEITDRLRQFPEKREINNLPIQRDDEIGELAKSLSEMATIINNQIDSINSEKLKAEKAVQEKSEFLENISHEIRNPLQSIMGLTTLLENNNPNPNQLDILNSLKFNTTNLLGLVNNILDYQNVIKGDIQLNNTWVHVPKIIDEVVMGNKYSAVEKSILLETKFDEELYHLDFQLDKLRLSQILGNLIANAIKFTTAQGSVIVIGELINISNKRVLRLSVKDTGIGMTIEEVERIKERYFSNKGVQTMTSNFGLGLTIVSDLLKLFRSKLKVHSKKDEGSVFFFDIETEVREFVKSEESNRQLNLEGVHILVLEDDVQITNLYKHLLKDSGAAVSYFPDFEALEKTGEKYDLVVSDFRFSKNTLIEGLPVLKQVMSEKACLIIASATTPDLTQIDIDGKLIRFIRKPFTMNEFREGLILSIVTSSFGIPQTDEIKKDYDYKKEKYTNALNLLANEWSIITKCLTDAISNNDKDLLQSTMHKFITTMRRLKLQGLENWLLGIENEMPFSSFRKEQLLNKLNSVMLCYLNILKNSI
jgi:signal transduction histidine kinase/CheY-like chemotaxis protein